MAKFKKIHSKRKPLRLKYKILIKVAEHNRKLKRQKKSPFSKKSNIITIPNSLPFKEEILLQREALKSKSAKVTKREVDEVKCEVDDNPHAEDVQKVSLQNSKTYFKDLKCIVDSADILLEVLDARDPLGTRSQEIEDLVIRSGKKLVLLLNKIDLVPKENLDEWMKYLQMSLPTVAFKASTQNQAKNLSQSKTAAIHISQELQTSSRCIGASHLMKLLGNYSRNQNIQTTIKVGVIGLPNVGKSSLINSLKRSRACPVGGVPGLTTSTQEVSLTKHIKIIDTPGVVLSNKGSLVDLALKNALKVETLKDVITPAEAIVQKVDKAQLCLQYTVPEFKSSTELFAMLARRMGKMKKGGVPNVEDGARRILNDWNRGAIKYHTCPPEKFHPDVYLKTEIVQEMGKPFDVSSGEQMHWV